MTYMGIGKIETLIISSNILRPLLMVLLHDGNRGLGTSHVHVFVSKAE